MHPSYKQENPQHFSVSRIPDVVDPPPRDATLAPPPLTSTAHGATPPRASTPAAKNARGTCAEGAQRVLSAPEDECAELTGPNADFSFRFWCGCEGLIRPPGLVFPLCR
jgi:hypothetical protein